MRVRIVGDAGIASGEAPRDKSYHAHAIHFEIYQFFQFFFAFRES